MINWNKQNVWSTKTKSESEMPNFLQENYVGHYAHSIQYTHHRFFIDRGIGDMHEYQDLVQTLISCNEGDAVELVISSYGGTLESALNVVSAIQESNATVRAVITGSCHSAASVIALSCDEVIVLDFANMLCHNGTFGSFGKAPEVSSQVRFLDKYLTDMAHVIYKGFLTEVEINDMISGKDFWFNAEEIRERLEKRSELQEKEQARIIRELKKRKKQIEVIAEEKISTKSLTTEKSSV
jgi:ATP-dependent protease ClpP protease subunit